MKQKAALCLSFAALAVTGYLCLSPHAENRPVPPGEPAVTSSDQSAEQPDRVNSDERRQQHVVVIKLPEEYPFLYPTDQMFRELPMKQARPR